MDSVWNAQVFSLTKIIISWSFSHKRIEQIKEGLQSLKRSETSEKRIHAYSSYS